MKVIIAKKPYILQNTFSVLLRYMREFGESYLATPDDDGSKALKRVRLLWCAISGKKPDFNAFLEHCREGNDLANASMALERHMFPRPVRLMLADVEHVAGAAGSAAVDELDILHAMKETGTDASLVHDLTLTHLLELISRNKEEGRR